MSETSNKVRTYSYSLAVVIDAPDKASAKKAQAELWRLVDFAASTTNTVPDDGFERVPVTICVGENNDWEFIETRDAETEDTDDQ